MTRTADPIEISLTAIRAAKHNAERECEDAVTVAAAPFRERIDELSRAEAALEPLVARNGDGPAKPAGPPRKPGGRRRRTKHSTPAPSGPAAGGHKAQGDANRKRVLDHIRAHPGTSSKEMMDALGMDRSTIAGHLNKLISVSSGQAPVRMQKDPDDGRIRRYYAAQADMAPADESGVKTGDEQKIVDCLEAADGPLPPNELAVRSGIRSDFVPQMAQRLMQRGVIERVPPKRADLPPRYQPARKLADAVADAVA